MGDLSENFSKSEFVCPCCGQSKMHPGFIKRLQALRTEWGKPFTAVSGGGYRCAVYGSTTSAHHEGRAIDPTIGREDYHAFLEHALYYGFTGLGIKNKDGRFQMHIDDAEAQPGRPRPWVWTYT